jgi:hypothetical protein
MKTLNIRESFYGMEDEPTRAMTKLLLGIVGIWFVAAFVGGMKGIFYQPDEPPLTLGLFLLVPILGFTLAYRASSRLQHAVDAVPLWLITVAHIWRFVGLGFVIGAMMNVLPVQFGYPEGWGDIIAAALCLPLALAIRHRRHSQRLRRLFVAWNIFGLVDLVSAITLGILYSPSSFGVLRTDVSTGLMTTFPINLIPTFFVPLFMLLHALSLARSREIAGTKTT